jgi:hypothetical protein
MDIKNQPAPVDVSSPKGVRTCRNSMASWKPSCARVMQKIGVVSSAIESDPKLRGRYQFWVFVFPHWESGVIL